VKNILVVGGGVIGLCTAYYATQRGHRVTVVERGDPNYEGCSFGNAGMVVPSHFVPLAAPGMVALGLKWMFNPASPFYLKPRLSWELLDWGWKFCRAAQASHVARSAPLLRDLHLASRACYEELSALPGTDFGLVKKGLLMLCKTDRAWAEESHAAELAGKLGIPVEVLDAKQTAAIDPKVRMEVAGSVFFPKDCHLTPGRFMAALRRWLDEAGSRFCWKTEATHWRCQGRRIEALCTPQGDLSADEYVLCGGCWSPIVARDLNLNLPMQAGKGYSVTLPNPCQLPQVCAIFQEARVAVTPMGAALRFGGTMELAGLTENINHRRVQGIIDSVPKYYPEFKPEHFQGLQPWCGLRPCTPDGLPYLGRAARYSNLTIATGHAMMGLSLGPITGKLVAEILSEEKPSIDLTALNPNRYG
jgi:D-amino-acid dehydrogenase